MKRIIVSAFVAMAAVALSAQNLGSQSTKPQKFEGLAQTPPMGWNSWNTFGTNVTAQLVKETADLFVKLGLKDAGYEYVVIDDGWMEMERDAETYLLVPHKEKFPQGMKEVADYVHSKGLKLGIYNCAGIMTCAGYPGTRGYEFIDARQYAEWGIDYLKYDWCHTGESNGGLSYQQDARASYTIMRDALYKAGRPILFSICEWGDNQPWLWGEPVGHMWRVTGDIINCWDCELNHGGWAQLGLWEVIRKRGDIRKYSGPGHWNDYDMLEVGNGFSPAEDRTHFTMWCMLASPLMLGNDIRSMSKETLELITNKELIAIDQDKLGIQGFRYLNDNGFEIWVKPLENEEWAVAFVNMTENPRQLSYDWKKHPLQDILAGKYVDFNNTTYTLRDVFAKKAVGDTSKKLERVIEGHDVAVYRISQKK